MVQRPGPLVSSLALLLPLLFAAPARAVTWPCEFCGPQPDTRITVEVYNNEARVQQVRVAGHIYTLMPWGHLTLKAPAGTQVFAVSRSVKHHRGDLLFAFAPALNQSTVTLD
jgi:hypothetical protein